MRFFRSTTLAAACALALAAPSTALADHGETISDPTVDAYMRVAAEYWGGQLPQCTGPQGEAIPAHAVYGDNPDPAVGAWAEVPGCRIWLDRTHWPAAPSETHCNLLAHEWGHLLGQEHSPDQTSLMWGGWINKVVPGCVAFRAQAPAPGPAPAVAATPPAKKRAKKSKLREKTRRGRQRCVRVRRHKVSRRSRVAKNLPRMRKKRCARKHRRKHARKHGGSHGARHVGPAPVSSLHSLARL
jgi:hypothetical protein